MRELVTDLLEVVGFALLIAAVAVAGWTFITPAAGLAFGAGGCLGASALLVKVAKPKTPAEVDR